MLTVEAISEVAPDQMLRIELPKSVTPGQHRVVVVIDEHPVDQAQSKPNWPLRLTKLHFPP